MNVSENTPLHSMSKPEQSLFLKMLDTLRDKESVYSDSYAGYIRLKMSDEHCDEILDLYRPQENIDDSGTELSNAEFLNYKEEKLLKHLSPRGAVRLPSQFSAIGYQQTASGVEFTMLHPSINYLLEAYSKSYADGSSSTELNSELINSMNKIYHDYNYHKNEIDEVLNKVYDAHGGTLNIAFAGKNHNQIVTSPHAEMTYLFQATRSLQDISNTLDAIFHKWTGSDKI